MNQVEKLFKQAIDAHQKHDLVDAQTYYTQILALEPYSIQAHWRLATIYWQHNDLEKVQAHYQTLLALIPHSPALLNNLAALSLKQNQLDRAIDYFRQALDIEPKHKESRNNLAASLLQKNELNESIWHYALYLNLEPNDINALYNRAHALMLTGQLDKAIEDLKKILTLDAHHIDANCNLAAIYLKLEDNDTAIHYYQQILALQSDHPIACYMLSALNQTSIPPTPPFEYVKHLFDNYALQFDKHLKETLAYKTPELLYEHTKPFLKNKKYNLLDLGCGTGLSAVPFAAIAETLTGIDISGNMLTQAKAKGCYTTLIENDILSSLTALKEIYDLILCVDTLVYFGDLDAVFEKTAFRLKTEGLFSFSIELAKEGKTPYQLQVTGRYQHTNSYIETLAKRYHLEILKQLTVDSRYQKNEFVKSRLFVLKK
jgi:predicted TPR repeat methyltransferase